MFGKRKGISTFIATLLLMVLAVSAGVVIYAYTMGYMGGFGGTDTLGAMSLDEGEMTDATTDEISAYVRNIGKTSLILDTVYVDGVECVIYSIDSVLVSSTVNPPIKEGDVGLVVIHKPATPPTGYDWLASNTYEIKLIAEDNTQLSFSLKCQ
jgi:hypothetical protein